MRAFVRFDRPVCSRWAQELHHTSAQLLRATDAAGMGDPNVQASGSSFAAVCGLATGLEEMSGNRCCLTRNNSALRAYSRLRVFGRKVLYDPQGDTIFRKEFHDQKTRFCVCCIDGSSPCSARAGEATGVVRSTSAVRSAREPDYRERKRFLLVCEHRGRRCGAENAGRKLLLQADTGGSHFWPDRWPCGRRFVHVLLA